MHVKRALVMFCHVGAVRFACALLGVVLAAPSKRQWGLPVSQCRFVFSVWYKLVRLIIQIVMVVLSLWLFWLCPVFAARAPLVHDYLTSLDPLRCYTPVVVVVALGKPWNVCESSILARKYSFHSLSPLRALFFGAVRSCDALIFDALQCQPQQRHHLMCSGVDVCIHQRQTIECYMAGWLRRPDCGGQNDTV